MDSDKTKEVTESKPTEEENKTDPKVADVVVDNDDDDDKEKTPDKESEVEEEEEEEEQIYQPQLPNRVIVARNHPLSYYVDRARRILRMEKDLSVSGRGNTISMACTLVEVLKRQKIAVISKISTGMNVEPFFNASGDPRWSQPTSMITFTLVRGEFAEFVADYHQRKVIEIFESQDDDKSGEITFDQVAALEFEERFKANTDQIEQSKKFISDKQSKDKGMNLPDFIRYASLLIHPLLRDRVFKDVLKTKFGITATDNRNSGGPPAAGGT